MSKINFKKVAVATMCFGLGLSATAQETKEGFFKRAFRDMKESAKLQRQIDKANYEATKLESKAFFEEQKRLSNPKLRSESEKARMEKELQAAKERRDAAQAKVDSIRTK